MQAILQILRRLAARGGAATYRAGRKLSAKAIKQAKVIDGAIGNALSSGGVVALRTLAKSQPSKFIATAVGISLIDNWVLEDLIGWYETSSDSKERSALESVFEQVHQLYASAGLTDEYPDQDGKVGNEEVSEMQVNIALFKQAEEAFQRAAAAVGGPRRLIAIMDYLKVDPDLKHLVEQSNGF